MELERILQKQGFGSRKTCRAMIRDGRVLVNGELCDDPFADIDTAGLHYTVDDEDWEYHESATLVLNKPTGMECSRNPIHHPSVYSLLPYPLLERGVQSIGRLDEDTTGLLLFTDDGQLNHKLISPKHKVPKTYRVTLKHAADAAIVKTLLAGVLLHDEPERIAAADCALEDPTTLRLVITEGKYHQVKRMIAAAGNRVEALHRVAVGEFTLPDDLEPGEWRWLSEAELAQVKAAR